MRSIRKSLVGSWSSRSNFWDFELSEMLWLILFVSNLLLKSKELAFFCLNKLVSVINVILKGFDMLF